MSLFDAIAGAIANPNQQGNSDQLSSILGAVQAIAGSHTGDPSNSTNLMSAVGNAVQGALQNHQATAGTEGVENLVNQVASGNTESNPVQALFGGQEQQIVDTIAQSTGIGQSNQCNAAKLAATGFTTFAKWKFQFWWQFCPQHIFGWQPRWKCRLGRFDVSSWQVPRELIL
jgi:hypothetical protein